MRNLSPKKLFFALTGLFALLSVALLITSRGRYLDDLIYLQGTDRFMDFFNHIAYTQVPAQTYQASELATFPPLAYLMYRLFNRMLPEGAAVINSASATAPYGILLYVIYVAATSVLLFYGIARLAGRKRSGEGLLLCLAVLISNTYVFGVVERGNSVVVVAVFLMLAVLYRNDARPALREFALVMIAFAAGFKLYPAVFGLLYLSEKKWREAARLVGYGLAAFFIPFLFFGGLSGLRQFLANQTTIQNYAYHGVNSVYAIVNQLSLLATGDAARWRAAGKIATLVFAGLTLFGFFFTETYWKKLMLLCSLMVVVPFWSGDYTCIYFALPLALFLWQARKTRADCVYAAGFALIFALFVWGSAWFVDVFGSNCAMTLRYVAIYAMTLMIVAEALKRFIGRLRGMREKKTAPRAQAV